MKQIILLIILAIPFTVHLQAQNYLRVGNSWDINSASPSWHNEVSHGVFEELSIITEPQGIYTQVDVYATIGHENANNWWWSEALEIVWQFDLPNKSLVIDSWLWFGDEIIQAEVVEFATGLETYSSVIAPPEATEFIDPSFLFQTGTNSYEIRIYPLLIGDTRKIKMSFLIPNQWDQEEIKTSLLSNIFDATDYTPNYLTIGFKNEAEWDSPSLQVGNANYAFNGNTIGVDGEPFKYTEVFFEQFIAAEDASLIHASKLTENNSYFASYENEGEEYYQLVVVPDWESTLTEGTRKTMILIDYDQSATSLSLANLHEQLIAQLNNSRYSENYINICYNGASESHCLSETWHLYEPDSSPELILDLLSQQELESNFVELLEYGLTWSNTANTETDELVLFACNDDFSPTDSALSLYVDLDDHINPETPISIFNLQNQNLIEVVFGDNLYAGNELLYNLLVSGNSSSQQFPLVNNSSSLDDWFNPFLADKLELDGEITTSYIIEDGWAYDVYPLTPSTTSNNISGAVYQTGKFTGELAMELQVGIFNENGDYALSNTTVSSTNGMNGNELLQTIWYGSDLKQQVAEANTTEAVEAVIQESIEERILCELTAFLAVEPDLGGEICTDCEGDDVFQVGLEEIAIKENDFIVSPNPCQTHTRITLSYSGTFNAEEWQAEIYDALGRIVNIVDKPTYENNIIEWNWDIAAELEAGIYYCKIRNSQQNYSVKIVVVD